MTPRLSVVMSVWNGAAHLPATLDSVLGQTFRDFECIVIDDGSTDETPSILADYTRRDPRLRIIRQDNTGLTRALMRGCDEARGELIARQDCGDRSRPERFARAVASLEADPSAVLAACEVEYVGPNDEPLYVTNTDAASVRRSLLHDDVDHITALPHHGAAVFRADAYRRAGGYRAEFRVAQDVDLWIRLAALGAIVIDPEPLYVARTDPAAISSAHREAQVALASIAISIRGADDATRARLLARAAAVKPRRGRSRLSEARGLYFIGSCLRRRGDARWRGYIGRALARNPLHWRALLMLLMPRRM